MVREPTVRGRSLWRPGCTCAPSTSISTRPIYFSVDIDVDGAQVLDYFKGVASVIGEARTGGYGSYRLLQYLLNVGAIAWGWQTYAWSGGLWELRAHIQQYQNGMVMAGANVDYDRSIKSDFGQWQVGGTMGVPTGWRDDGTILYSPSSVAGGQEEHITGPFRDYILANNWPNSNVAGSPGVHVDQLELSNTNIGPGMQQTFRYALLGKPDSGSMAGKVIFEWLGTELAYVRNLYTDALIQVASLKSQLAAATQPTGLDPAKVKDRLTAIGLAASNGNAAILNLVNQPFS